MGAMFMTPRQVAERWECSTRHVRQLCADGDLPAMRIGLAAWRIAASAVEEYERAKTTGQPAEEPRAAAPAKEVTPPVVVDGFTLPDGYEPVFPNLWGREAHTKKTAPVRG